MDSSIKQDFHTWVEKNNLTDIQKVFEILICEARAKKVKPIEIFSTFKEDTNYFIKLKEIHSTYKVEDPYTLKSLLMALKLGFPNNFLEMILKEKEMKRKFIFYLNSSLYFFIVCRSYNVPIDNEGLGEISFLLFNGEYDTDYLNRLVNILLKSREIKDKNKLFFILKNNLEKKSSIVKIENEIKLLISK